MATKKTTTEPAEEVTTTAAETEYDPWEKVELRIPRGADKDDPNILIGFNGVNYLLPKGKTSVVPRCVADEYYRAQAAVDSYYETMDRLLDNSK